jgi:hypothetical protein
VRPPHPVTTGVERPVRGTLSANTRRVERSRRVATRVGWIPPRPRRRVRSPVTPRIAARSLAVHRADAGRSPAALTLEPSWWEWSTWGWHRWWTTLTGYLARSGTRADPTPPAVPPPAPQPRTTTPQVPGLTTNAARRCQLKCATREPRIDWCQRAGRCQRPYVGVEAARFPRCKRIDWATTGGGAPSRASLSALAAYGRVVLGGWSPVMPSHASDGAVHGPPPWAGGPE